VTAHPSATADVLVIGGGPGGATAATQLAKRGRRVIVVERQVFAHTDISGALLTPRSLVALSQLDLGPSNGSGPFHRVRQVRFSYAGRSTSTTWPSHPTCPPYGAVASRATLTHRMLRAAESAGATVFAGHEATDPIVERGFARGANVTAPDGTTFEARAEYTIVADGANSRFGRALGTFRKPTWPYALAHRATYRSPLHDASEIELLIDLRDRSDTPITGYGWLVPSGDGNVTVGVMLMSTSPSFQVLNPAHVLERVIADHGDRWHLDAEPVVPSVGGRIPLGMSVGPTAGPTYLLIGDAVGAANPLSGAGIEAALETGALAADVVDEALRSESAATLQQYTRLIAERYGSFYKVGRLATRLLGQPPMSRRINRMAATRKPAADAYLRLATNELRPGRAGIAEFAYRLGRAAGIVAPDA
jgi:geranylgeranyl reductase family protein